jgi:hypothetical protein
MVSAGSFLVYIVPGFSGQGNLLITDNMVKRRALNSFSGETTNDLRKATEYYMINKGSRSELRGIASGIAPKPTAEADHPCSPDSGIYAALRQATAYSGEGE